MQEYFKFVESSDWQVEDDDYQSLLNENWSVQVAGARLLRRKDYYLVWEHTENSNINHYIFDTLEEALSVCHGRASEPRV